MASVRIASCDGGRSAHRCASRRALLWAQWQGEALLFGGHRDLEGFLAGTACSAGGSTRRAEEGPSGVLSPGPVPPPVCTVG